MRKTRKQKAESNIRREKFLYSLEKLNLKETTEKNQQKESAFKKEEIVETSTSHALPREDYSYLRRDLTRILIFCAFALGIQIVLHLTLL